MGRSDPAAARLRSVAESDFSLEIRPGGNPAGPFLWSRFSGRVEDSPGVGWDPGSPLHLSIMCSLVASWPWPATPLSTAAFLQLPLPINLQISQFFAESSGYCDQLYHRIGFRIRTPVSLESGFRDELAKVDSPRSCRDFRIGNRGGSSPVRRRRAGTCR